MSRFGGGILPPPDCGDPEDCGDYCVWWFSVSKPRRPREVKWAYKWRSACGTYWITASGETWFDSRESAVAAAEKARSVNNHVKGTPT